MRWTIYFLTIHLLCSQATATSPFYTSQESRPFNSFYGKKIAIVGAGPVGLYTARRISDEHRNVEIKVFEIQTEYKGQQVVYLSGWNIPKKESPKMNGNHSIKKIENLLKDELLRRLGVLFYKWEFTDIDSLIHRFYKTQKPDVIIFANGAETKVRDQYFDGSQVSMPYANSFLVAYRRAAGAKAEALSNADTYRVSKLIDTQIFQHVENQVDVRVTMTGPHTYDQFRQKMNALINARRVELSENVVTNPITSFGSMRVSIAKKVQSKYDTIQLYLIGDAAATLPFQLGLNSGFTSVEILVKDPRYYMSFVKDHFNKMKSAATWEHTMSEYRRKYNKLNSKVPWQLVRWHKNYEKLLLTTSDITSDFILKHPITRKRKLLIERAWYKVTGTIKARMRKGSTLFEQDKKSAPREESQDSQEESTVFRKEINTETHREVALF